MSKIAVIGAGASGIIAALNASKNNEVILIDSNDKCGKKILLTGNGRCNYWNSDITLEQYETDDKEVLSKIITEENKSTVLAFLDSLGIYPKIKNGYYYPYSNQATSIREILQKEITKHNIDFVTNFKVANLLKKEDKFIITSIDNEIIKVDKVIIAMGSKSYPKTGSDGSGYEIAKSLGHKINLVTPTLTSLTANEKFLKEWENIRCDAKVTLYVEDRKAKEEQGEIQLTKNGISGICVFNISGLASKNIALGKKVYVTIDFMPHIDNLYNWFDERDRIVGNKTIEEQLESIFNYKLMFVLLKRANISKDKKWSDLSDKDKKALATEITNFKLEITGTESFEKCQVCTGGVSLKEINSDTMESKILDNLYFVGEILDVDGKCGGFNLAFAWITGYIAGRGV